MHSLRRTLIFLICACAVFLSLVRSNTGPPSQPSIATIFSDGRNPCAIPCLFGIYVGQPTSEAMKIIASHSLLKDSPIIQNGFNSIAVHSQWGYLFFEASNDNTIIRQVWIDFRNTTSAPNSYKASLGDLVAQLGNPSFINMYKTSGNRFGCSTVHYNYMGSLNLSVNSELIFPSCYGIHNPLTMVTLKQMDNYDLIDMARWPGFIATNIALLSSDSYLKPSDMSSVTAHWQIK